MKKRAKKAAVLVLTGILMFLMSGTVYEADASSSVISAVKHRKARNIEPDEWNRTQFYAYQFDDTSQVLQYMMTGGMKYYNHNFKSEDRMVKITVADPGVLMLETSTDGKGNITCYDSKMKVRAKADVEEDDIEYAARVKAGDVFYIQMPSKLNQGMIMASVLKETTGPIQRNREYIQAGTGGTTYHEFQIASRAAAHFQCGAIVPNEGNCSLWVEKKVKTEWKKIGNTVNVFAGDEEGGTFGLNKGTYRLGVRAETGQAAMLTYSRRNVSKKVAYRKSKARRIRIDGEAFNMYTTGEKASRWYKVTVPSRKRRYYLGFDGETTSGGFRFKVYKKGRKKPLATRTIKKSGDLSVKLPKKKGTYYIKIYKISQNTNGTYGISFE